MRHSSKLDVSLPYLAENIKSIQALSGKARILPMVKSNAYGHGFLPVAKFLSHELNIPQLGVASLGEAMALIKDEPTLPSRIYVFSETDIHHSDYSQFYLHHDALPVLHQLADVERVVKDPAFNSVPLVIKLNTGMNRLGVDKDEWEKLVQILKRSGRTEIEHLMTHFACSSFVLREGDRTHGQYNQFKEAKAYFEAAGIKIKETSVSNSGAIEQKFGVEETFVRPGLMMYGPASVEIKKPSGKEYFWHGKNVSKLQTTVLKIRTIKKGTPVGYGNHVAGDDGMLVVVPLGYGDGILTFASGAHLTVKGKPCQLFARVNMDMAFLFFKMDDFPKLEMGERLDLWDHDATKIMDLADEMKTHPYQLLCALSSRLPRFYSVG